MVASRCCNHSLLLLLLGRWGWEDLFVMLVYPLTTCMSNHVMRSLLIFVPSSYIYNSNANFCDATHTSYLHASCFIKSLVIWHKIYMPKNSLRLSYFCQLHQCVASSSRLETTRWWIKNRIVAITLTLYNAAKMMFLYSHCTEWLVSHSVGWVCILHMTQRKWYYHVVLSSQWICAYLCNAAIFAIAIGTGCDKNNVASRIKWCQMDQDFCANFVLQAMKPQGLGTRLLIPYTKCLTLADGIAFHWSMSLCDRLCMSILYSFLLVIVAMHIIYQSSLFSIAKFTWPSEFQEKKKKSKL